MCSLKPFHQSRREVNEVKLMAADGTQSCKLAKKNTASNHSSCCCFDYGKFSFPFWCLRKVSPEGEEVDFFRIFMLGKLGVGRSGDMTEMVDFLLRWQFLKRNLSRWWICMRKFWLFHWDDIIFKSKKFWGDKISF